MLQHLQYVPTYSEEDAFDNQNAFLTTKRISPLVLFLKLKIDLESWRKVSRFPESPWLFCASIDMTVLQALRGQEWPELADLSCILLPLSSREGVFLQQGNMKEVTWSWSGER